MNTPQKQIGRPAQVLTRVIAGTQSAAQEAVQGQSINGGLHVVAVLGHGGVQTLGGVSGIVVAQGIGLVVQHPITAPVVEHQIHETHQHAVQGAALQAGARHPGHQVGLAQLVKLSGLDAVRRQPKLHLRAQRRQIGQSNALLDTLLDAKFVLWLAVKSGYRVLHHLQQPFGQCRRSVFVHAFASGLQLGHACRLVGQLKALGRQPVQLLVQPIARQRTALETVSNR